MGAFREMETLYLVCTMSGIFYFIFNNFLVINVFLSESEVLLAGDLYGIGIHGFLVEVLCLTGYDPPTTIPNRFIVCMLPLFT